MAKSAKTNSKTTGIERRHDLIALVLQGGGALGAYQAGAYDELSGTDYQPDWIAGVSIGAINAALIAGNPPAARVELVLPETGVCGRPTVASAASDCCGGPVKSGASACCSTDEQAKVSGKGGCGSGKPGKLDAAAARRC